MKSKLLHVLFRVLGSIGPDTRSLLGKALGNIASLIPTREREVAIKQVQLFFPDKDARRIVRGMYANLGQTTLEALHVPPFLKKFEKRFEVNDPELLERLLAEKKPIVALTAHTGNWDLMAAYMVARGAPLTTVGKPARSKALQDVLVSMREAYGIRMLWRTGKGGTKDVIKELQEARVVAALIDQDTRVSSVWTPFFGRPAKTPSGIVALAKRYDALIATCFNIRVGLNSFKLIVDTIDHNLSIDSIIAEYNRQLEAIVREHPEQWVWVHKRWRSPNENLTMSSKEYITFLEQQLGQSA